MARVKVSEGLLEGERVENEYGGTFYSFKGIPYAQPPVGDLRFKAPLPPKPWEGVRSVKQFGNVSFQFDAMTGRGLVGSEDSLYLNIYTPDVKPDKPLPVMFWVHGGGFICGSGEDDLYGPEFLVKEGVILITFNYRLDALGFLCLNTEDIPGNAGLKDQVEALRWVNKNISSFGGDPNNITIFGESAGGGSVSYLLVSPMSKGLFKRAIVQSGSTLCPWARTYKPRERALALARQLGCFSEDDKQLYEFFKNQPASSFVGTSVPIFLSETNEEYMSFVIAEEKDFKGIERFFAGDYIAVHEGVEIIVGYNSDEGLVNMGPGNALKTKMERARDFPETFVTKLLALDLTMNQQLELGKKMRKFYFNDKIDISSDDWELLAKYYSMERFVYGILNFTKACARKANVYLYKFSCKSERNIFYKFIGIPEILENKSVTSHGDDLFYMFNAKMMPKIDTKSKTFRLIENVVKLWTNFAKHGNPTPDESLGVKWAQYTEEKQDYLDIGNQLVAGTAPEADELKFWDSIFEEYGQKLI